MYPPSDSAVFDQASKQSFDVELTGCRPEPLASYLKALGVFRLVAEQRDQEARGFWRGEHFVLRSALNRESLAEFFARQWQPTPVVAPWNGGSGFYPKDNRKAADTIVASTDSRLAKFAAAIQVARSLVARRGWVERPADADKRSLLSEMRAQLPDEALAWVDAAVVIGDDRLLFPPLLGTGGNDGRLDFSNNFQQRVMELMATSSTAAVDSSLFGTAMKTDFKGAMGQYQPSAHRRTNPWDFVLLIEGALMLASAATRRYENASPSLMAFPFHARAAGGSETLTDDDERESRDELWLPLWAAPASIREVRRLFAEGRATVGSGDRARPASSALDFARAVAALGVDRGIDAFVRIGFQVRNGLAYFATPLGRFATDEVEVARLLDHVDGWFNRFRRKSIGRGVPARVALARRRLEKAMFEAVVSGALGPVLLELGDAEKALALSLTFSSKAFLRPVPSLPVAWASAAWDGSIEQRLAAALSTCPAIRRRLIPLDKSGRDFGRTDDVSVVFTTRPLVENLQALLLREEVEAIQQEHGPGEESAVARCSLSDIAHFIAGDIDDVLVERWLRALVLIDGVLPTEGLAGTHRSLKPPAAFAVLVLVHHRRIGSDLIPRTTGVLARACAGDAVRATEAAVRRLNSCARPLPVRSIVEPRDRMRRIAAALAFPLTAKQRRVLESMVLPAIEPDMENRTTNSTATGSAQEPA